MPPEYDYLVVIKPPKNSIQSPANSIVKVNGPRVVNTTGYSAREAAEKANIQPGETAFVVKMSAVESFERAQVAPLVAAGG
jgi:hypothetical protein